MKLVTVFSAFNAAQAQVVRSRLEAAEFNVVVTNEISATLLPTLSNSGTILVQVPEAEADDARELLASSDASAE